MADLHQETRRTILIISALDIWSLGSGRGGPALWETLRGYSKRGWKVLFITGNGAKSESLDPHIHVIRFDAPWLKKLRGFKKIGFFTKAIFWSYFQIKSLIVAHRLNANHNIDVIYGYEIHGAPVANMLSKLWGVPVITRFQGTTLGVSWMSRKFWTVRAWEHIVGLKTPADLVIMANDGTQGDRVLQHLRVDMRHVRFWMNGVDWSLFRQLPSQKEARDKLAISAEYVLLTVSRLVSWKRVDRSIHALAEIVRNLPEVCLIIVGDGTDKDDLQRLVYKLCLQDHVHFAGAVSHDEVAKYMAAADVFLSLYDLSNVGNPLLEAMMTGICTITLNNGDTGGYLRNDDNGVLLEYEELPKLSQVILELLADEKRRKRLGINARKFAEEHFWSWDERMAAEVKEVALLIEQRRNCLREATIGR